MFSTLTYLKSLKICSVKKINILIFAVYQTDFVLFVVHSGMNGIKSTIYSLLTVTNTLVLE